MLFARLYPRPKQLKDPHPLSSIPFIITNTNTILGNTSIKRRVLRGNVILKSRKIFVGCDMWVSVEKGVFLGCEVAPELSEVRVELSKNGACCVACKAMWISVCQQGTTYGKCLLLSWKCRAKENLGIFTEHIHINEASFVFVRKICRGEHEPKIPLSE